MLIDWREAKYRRWGTAEVPAFGPAAPGMPTQAPPDWLARLARGLHDAPQGALPVLFALRRGEAAFALRVTETAQDGTGRADAATNLRWSRAASPASTSDRVCQALLAWLLKSRELLLDDADPQGLLAACATVAAVEAARAECLAAGLDLLVRLEGAAPQRLELPVGEGGAGVRASQALVRRLRAALLLAGERLEFALVAGLPAPPALDPPLLWLAPGAEPQPTPRALRLAERAARVWKLPLAELSRRVAESDLLPLPAFERALAPAELAWAAAHEPAQVAARWRALGDAGGRRDVARHVAAAAAGRLDALPLEVLALSDAFPADKPHLRGLWALFGADSALAGMTAAELDAAACLRLAPDVLARCDPSSRADWLRLFGRQACELPPQAPVALTPELAEAMHAALPDDERDLALSPLLRCAPASAALRRAALFAFLRGGAGRERFEDALPAPTGELLSEALRQPIGPAPQHQPPRDDARTRFWRYVALRVPLRGFTPAEQARALIRPGDGTLWQAAGGWTLAEGRSEVLLDLWLHAPAGTLRDVPLPASIGRLVQEAAARGAQPADNGPAWDRERAGLRLFLEGHAWARDLAKDPAAALRRLLDDQRAFECAREVGWDLVRRGPEGGEILRRAWRAWPREHDAARAALRSLSWPARLHLAEASEGRLDLDDLLALTES